MSDFINRAQIEVLSAADGERRRHWSNDDKRKRRPCPIDFHGSVTLMERRVSL